MMFSSMAKGPIHYIVKYQVGSWDAFALGCFLCRDFHWEMSGIICCLAIICLVFERSFKLLFGNTHS